MGDFISWNGYVCLRGYKNKTKNTQKAQSDAHLSMHRKQWRRSGIFSAKFSINKWVVYSILLKKSLLVRALAVYGRTAVHDGEGLRREREHSSRSPASCAGLSSSFYSDLPLLTSVLNSSKTSPFLHIKNLMLQTHTFIAPYSVWLWTRISLYIMLFAALPHQMERRCCSELV